jgi:hypothetical protein
VKCENEKNVESETKKENESMAAAASRKSDGEINENEISSKIMA